MNTSIDDCHATYEINGERLYSIKELARLLEVAPGTVRMCIYRGISPKKGMPPIKLERWRTIGGIRSSLEAVDRLHKRLAMAAESDTAS
jgi:hypothetical protein